MNISLQIKLASLELTAITVIEKDWDQHSKCEHNLSGSHLRKVSDLRQEQIVCGGQKIVM